jgi:RNA polymerase sigma-70 factor (ECF subfamily)
MNDIEGVDWRGRTHFFAVAAIQMRRVLVDHARAAAAAKRGANAVRVTLSENLAARPDRLVELLALDEALTQLAEGSSRQARIAEMRLFAGMEVKAIAEALGVSERTVKSDWRMARAWLMQRLGPQAG